MSQRTVSVLRRLALPVYLPTILGIAGSSAFLPVLPVIAVRLGFSVPGAAALGIIHGVFAFLGPIPVARAIALLGDRRLITVAGLLQALAGIVLGVMLTRSLDAGTPNARDRLLLVLGVVVISAGTVIWNVGRQAFLAQALPPLMRARAMTTLGGALRVGQVIGPLLGAMVIATGHTGWVLFLYAGMSLLAAILVAASMRTPAISDDSGPVPGQAAAAGSEQATAPASAPTSETAPASAPTPEPDELAPQPAGADRAHWRTQLRIALGLIPLMIARVNRPIVVPLLGLAVGLDESAISLMFGVAAVLEILLFIPAGVIMDRYGRAACAVPCLLGVGAGFAMLAPLGWGAEPSPEPAGWVFPFMLAAMLVMAVGNGLGSGIQMTLSVDLARPEHRTRDLGRWNTFMGAAPLGAPLLVSGVTLIAPVGAAAAAMTVLLVAGAWSLSRTLPAHTPAGTHSRR